VPGRGLVGLRIRNTENVQDKVVGISLRRRDQLKPDMAWGVLGKVIQSNARFALTDRLEVHLDHVIIRLLECREQLCDVVFTNIVWCHRENNAPHHLKNVTFVKGVPDFENPENLPTLIVLDDLMDSAHSAKVSQLFTKGSHHRNIIRVLIAQNLFHQGPSPRDISLNSKYIVVFKNPRDKTQIVHLARQVYPGNISSFHKTYLDFCKDPHYCSAGYYWVLQLIEVTLHLCNASIRTLILKLLQIHLCGSTAITCLAAAYIANSAVQYTPWNASDALSLTF